MTYQDHLETDRITTRFLTANDAALWVPFFADAVNSTFISFHITDTPEVRAAAWLQIALKRYEENRLGLQAIINKATGDFMGMAGLTTQEVAGKNEIEIGYHFLRKYWGQGYAAETAQLFRNYGFKNLDTPSIISIIHPLNFLSQRVALKNGMTLSEKSVTWRNMEVDLYRITRQEWEEMNK